MTLYGVVSRDSDGKFRVDPVAFTEKRHAEMYAELQNLKFETIHHFSAEIIVPEELNGVGI